MASSRREKELARQRAERQAARRAAAAARRKQRTLVLSSVAAVVVAVAAVVGIYLAVDDGGGPDTVRPAAQSSSAASPEASASPSAAAVEAPLAPGECRYTATTEPASRKVAPPPATGVEQAKKYTVALATDRGDIAFEMDSAATPCTANSLRSLAQQKYFDGTPCHRLTTKGIRVLQCGDPTGKGTGGPGYRFADEALTGATYPRGTVAMANSGPGSNGSQFFLVYGDSQLPAAYTPFGTITRGLEVLDQVAKAGSDSSGRPGDGKPKLPVTVRTLRVTDKAA